MRIAAVLLALALAPLARADTLTVFAAASLRESLDEALAAFQASTPHRVVASYAGSNALARQIENGAPAQLFISADRAWVDDLEAKRATVVGTRRVILRNELVLVAPAASRVRFKLAPGVDLAGALGAGRIAMANPDAVPAGRYAKAALTSLRAWAPVEGRVAAAGSVRGALALVARGEAPLGVVYRTDALAEKNVRVVDVFPASSHPPIAYTLVQVRGAPASAAVLADFLASARARAIFERHGFRAP